MRLTPNRPFMPNKALKNLDLATPRINDKYPVRLHIWSKIRDQIQELWFYCEETFLYFFVLHWLAAPLEVQPVTILPKVENDTQKNVARQERPLREFQCGTELPSTRWFIYHTYYRWGDDARWSALTIGFILTKSVPPLAACWTLQYIISLKFSTYSLNPAL